MEIQVATPEVLNLPDRAVEYVMTHEGRRRVRERGPAPRLSAWDVYGVMRQVARGAQHAVADVLDEAERRGDYNDTMVQIPEPVIRDATLRFARWLWVSGIVPRAIVAVMVADVMNLLFYHLMHMESVGGQMVGTAKKARRR